MKSLCAVSLAILLLSVQIINSKSGCDVALFRMMPLCTEKKLLKRPLLKYSAVIVFEKDVMKILTKKDSVKSQIVYFSLCKGVREKVGLTLAVLNKSNFTSLTSLRDPRQKLRN